MAAGRAHFCSSKLLLLFWPRNNINLQTRAIAKASSVGLWPRTSLIRHLCRSSVVCEEKTRLSAASSSKTRAQFKAECYHIRKLCEGRRLYEASDMLDKLLESFRDTNASFTSVFNCALHHAVKNNDNVLVEIILSNMKKNAIKRDSATYYIITSLYSQRGLLREGINTLKEMQAELIRGTPRNYQPLIELAAQLGKIDTMFSLYEEVKTKHASCHQFDAVVIKGVVDSNETEKWSGRVFEILHKMKLDRVKLPKETARVVARWFGSQGNDSWQVNWSAVNSSGVCQSCNHGLESGALSSLEHAVLEQHITDYLWESTQGRKMTSYTTIGSFADKHYPEDGHHLPYSLEKYIHETGPYDVVLDALNVGYYGNKGEFHPKQVEETVQYFLDKDKKVLVVGAPPMLTRKMRNASQEDFASMVDIMSKNCGMFLIRVRSNKNIHKLCIPDDIFILLAAVHCGLNTLLVSNDLFQDHMYKLPLNAQVLLARWLRSNQVLLQRSSKENIINYKQYPSYDPVVQTTGTTWHLPLDDTTTWLCCHKRQ